MIPRYFNHDFFSDSFVHHCCAPLSWTNFCSPGEFQTLYLDCLTIVLNDAQCSWRSRAQRCNIVATLFFKWLQHCSNIATLCCAKNRRRQSPRVTSPWWWLLYRLTECQSLSTRQSYSTYLWHDSCVQTIYNFLFLMNYASNTILCLQVKSLHSWRPSQQDNVGYILFQYSKGESIVKCH